MKYDCLIIDDEKLLADSTAEYFNLFGVSTAVAYSASECRSFFRENRAELLLLDINLGDGSGFALCRELRERTDVPILFISARASDDDKLIALHIGGDDYVQKPYSLSVLLAKVKVVLKRYGRDREGEAFPGSPGSREINVGTTRRTYAGTNQGINVGTTQGTYADTTRRTYAGITQGIYVGIPGGSSKDAEGSSGSSERYFDGRLAVDFPAKQVRVDGQGVRLTALEFKLLAYLVRNGNRVLSKQELFENVWEDKFTGDGTLNVHIRRLREAIERDPGNPEYILTVWGDGYRFCGAEMPER